MKQEQELQEKEELDVGVLLPPDEDNGIKEDDDITKVENKAVIPPLFSSDIQSNDNDDNDKLRRHSYIWKQGYLFHARQISTNILRISGLLSLPEEDWDLVDQKLQNRTLLGLFPEKCKSVKYPVHFRQGESCRWCSISNIGKDCFIGKAQVITHRNDDWGPKDSERKEAIRRGVDVKNWKLLRDSGYRGEVYSTGVGEVTFRCDFINKPIYEKILYQEGEIIFDILQGTSFMKRNPRVSPSLEKKYIDFFLEANLVQCKKMIFGFSEPKYTAAQARYHNQVFSAKKTIAYISGFEAPDYFGDEAIRHLIIQKELIIVNITDELSRIYGDRANSIVLSSITYLQAALRHDCFERAAKMRSRWAMFLDTDEFVTYGPWYQKEMQKKERFHDLASFAFKIAVPYAFERRFVRWILLQSALVENEDCVEVKQATRCLDYMMEKNTRNESNCWNDLMELMDQEFNIAYSKRTSKTRNLFECPVPKSPGISGVVMPSGICPDAFSSTSKPIVRLGNSPAGLATHLSPCYGDENDLKGYINTTLLSNSTFGGVRYADMDGIRLSPYYVLYSRHFRRCT